VFSSGDQASHYSSPLAEIRFLSDLAHDDVRIPLTSPS
jgi:hypothetical protein